MQITEAPTALDGPCTPRALAEGGPLSVSTAWIAYVPRQVSQACARLVLADTEDVVEVREQGSAVKVPLVAGAVRAGLQGSMGGLAERGHVQAHPSARPAIVCCRSRKGDT